MFGWVAAVTLRYQSLDWWKMKLNFTVFFVYLNLCVLGPLGAIPHRQDVFIRVINHTKESSRVLNCWFKTRKYIIKMKRFQEHKLAWKLRFEFIPLLTFVNIGLCVFQKLCLYTCIHLFEENLSLSNFLAETWHKQRVRNVLSFSGGTCRCWRANTQQKSLSHNILIYFFTVAVFCHSQFIFD